MVMINGKPVDPAMEVNGFKKNTAPLRKEEEEDDDDDVSSSSSSSGEDSDADEPAEPEKPQGNSAVELTLRDDEQSALVQPEDEDELEETLTDSSK